MKREEVQCYTCSHCIKVHGEEEYAAAISCKLREITLEADGAEGYDYRLRYRLRKEGAGFAYISVPTKPCPYYSKGIPVPLPPEPKLIHSPCNWQQYREIKHGC